MLHSHLHFTKYILRYRCVASLKQKTPTNQSPRNFVWYSDKQLNHRSILAPWNRLVAAAERCRLTEEYWLGRTGRVHSSIKKKVGIGPFTNIHQNGMTRGLIIYYTCRAFSLMCSFRDEKAQMEKTRKTYDIEQGGRHCRTPNCIRRKEISIHKQKIKWQRQKGDKDTVTKRQRT